MAGFRSIYLVIFLFTVLKFQVSHGNGEGTKVEMIHRHNLLPRNWSNGERMRELLKSDAIRMREISLKTRRQLKQIGSYDPLCNNGSDGYSESVELPMHSAADLNIGQYFVDLEVGSPEQKLRVIVDSGSDLTWMNCKRKCHGDRCAGNYTDKQYVFHADNSSSFRTVPCSSHMCSNDLSDLFSVRLCASPENPCVYDYKYKDGSESIGVFANETVTFSLMNGTKTKLYNVLVGCNEITRAQGMDKVDGVMGLGYNNYSIALEVAERFGGKFSYCLVDHLSHENVSSYLVFGSHKQVSISFDDRMKFTELIPGVISSYYAVNMQGISVGGSMLDIPAETWDLNGEGGMIMDSGSTLTYLTPPAYEPVMAALVQSLLDFKNLNRDDMLPMEYCFNSTGFVESLVPRLAFHFADGAVFVPPVKSYVIDTAPHVKCLGFGGIKWPGASIFGNIMQQNHFWEFDVANGKLGFASSSCT